MTFARQTWPASAAVALCAGTVLAQSAPSTPQAGAPPEAADSENEIVVIGYPEIVVNGRAIRCRAAPGDPLQAVNIGRGSDLMAILPDGEGGYLRARNAEQVTGPEFWQRVGIGMERYVFRVPPDGKPMCVGGRDEQSGFAGFRRILDAAPYRGHRVRFTAWVATGRAGQVSFWLAAGTVWREKPKPSERPRPNKLLNGGNTNHLRFGGDNGWTPVLIETGPIHKDAHHISYGFNLQGAGDVWVYQPRLDIVADHPENPAEGDRIEIGRETP